MEVIIPIFAGGIGVAIVQGIFSIIQSKQASKTGVQKNVSTLTLAIRLMLQDRIEYLAQNYILKGEVTFSARKSILDLHNMYHNELAGNGTLDELMTEFKKVKIVD